MEWYKLQFYISQNKNHEFRRNHKKDAGFATGILFVQDKIM